MYQQDGFVQLKDQDLGPPADRTNFLPDDQLGKFGWGGADKIFWMEDPDSQDLAAGYLTA